MSFPLLRLSYLPMRRVLAGLELMDQIYLSLFNERVRDAIRSLRKVSTCSNICITKTYMGIGVMFPKDKQSVSFRIDRLTKPPIAAKLYGQVMKINRNRSGFILAKVNRNVEKNYANFNHLLAHLDDMFRLTGLYVSLEYINLRGYLFENWTSFLRVAITNQKLTLDQASFFFERIQTKSLELYSTTMRSPSGARIFPLNHTTIELDNFDGLQFAAFFNMSCQLFSIDQKKNENFQVRDLVQFVSCWFNGGLSDVVRCVIVLPRTWSRQNANGIAQAVFDGLAQSGIQTQTPTDRQRTIQRYDGKVALVTIDSEFKFEIPLDLEGYVNPIKVYTQSIRN